LVKKYADKGFVLVAPSLDAEAGVQKFKEKHTIEYPLLAGARKTAMQTYGVQGYPTMFVVGKDGKVLWKGHFKDDEFIKVIEKALEAK
jgi:peroxiredoxin